MRILVTFIVLTNLLSCGRAQENSSKNQDELQQTTESLEVRTKHDSKVTIIYALEYVAEKPELISAEKDILDSLYKFNMYEMWAMERETISIILKEVYERTSTNTKDAFLIDVEIPIEAENSFRKTEKARQEILDELLKNKHQLVELINELNSNTEISIEEKEKKEQEIKTIERRVNALQKKGASLNYNLEL